MVSRISQAQNQSLPDLMANNEWTFMFGNIPNYGDGFSALSLKAQSCHIPGVSQEAFAVPIAGFVRYFRGRRVYSHQLQIAFAEDSNITALAALRNWLEYTVGTDSGTSAGYISDYGVTSTLYTFDTTGKAVDVANFYRLQITNLADVSLTGASTGQMAIQASFVCDYTKFNNISTR